MKQLLVLAALVVAAQSWGTWKKGLSVRFGIGLGIGRDFYISVPQSLAEAKNSRWVESTRPAGQPVSRLVLYNPSIDDVVLGAFYDTDGSVAGIQIALPQDSFTDSYYDWAGQGFTEWTAPANAAGVSRTYWATAVYFVSDETRAFSNKQRAASNGRIYQGENIYVTSFNGDLMPIPTVASKVADTATTLFTKQACIPFMGRHYYYNMGVNTECTTETILPWFPLVDEASGVDQLIGVGFMTAGKLPAESLVRDYFERPTEENVRLIVDDGPECLYNITGEYGTLTMHIYFVDSPLLINCF